MFLGNFVNHTEALSPVIQIHKFQPHSAIRKYVEVEKSVEYGWRMSRYLTH
jgi:hypothetical protein